MVVLSVVGAKLSDLRHSLAKTPAWQWMSWITGHQLDNFGRRLMRRRPRLGAIYASWWTPGPPRIGVQPGWLFAGELYPRLLWLPRRRDVFWKAAQQRGLTVPLSVPWYGGTTVEVTLGTDNSLCLYVCGSYEPNEFTFLDGVLKAGMTFVDVGANDGLYTLFAAGKVGDAGRVVSVEPSSRERSHLQHNLERNAIGNVTVVAAALGAAGGVADLKVADGHHTGHNTLGDFAHGDVAIAGSERVEVETLDTLAGRLGLSRIDVIKIDVEGAEGSVLAGARQTLASWRPILLLEVNDVALRAQGNSADALLALLRSELKYEILAYSDSTGRPEPWSPGQPISSNIVALPAERR